MPDHFRSGAGQRIVAQIAPCSWTAEKSQVESREHQDNPNIYCQPFPESVSEEREIHTDYDGRHRQHVKDDAYLSAHFSQHSPLCHPAPSATSLGRGGLRVLPVESDDLAVFDGER